MRDLKLDENWKLDMSGNDLIGISGSEETAQNVDINILTIRGEYEFNIELGVPWLDGMFGSDFLGVEREFELRKAILLPVGVDKINSFSYILDSELKTAIVNYSIDTIYGTTVGTVDDRIKL